MKKYLLSFLAACLLAGGANAATLVNHASPLAVTVGSKVLPDDYSGASPFSFNFDYAGGLAKFDLVSDNPEGGSAKYTLSGGTLASAITFTLGKATAPFMQSLSSGSFLLVIETAGRAMTTEISAVPLPGAALLFGSALLGAGALRRKKQQEEAEAVAA